MTGRLTIRLASLVALLAVCALGCSGGSTSAGPSSTPAGPSVSGSGMGSGGVGASYLAAMTTYVKAVEAAGQDCASFDDFNAQRRCFDAALAALDRFSGRVAELEFPTEQQPDVDALRAAISALDEVYTDARTVDDLTALIDDWWPRIDPADVAVLDAADALREALDLPPITVD